MKAKKYIAAARRLKHYAERIELTANAVTPREKQARTRAVNCASALAKRLFMENAGLRSLTVEPSSSDDLNGNHKSGPWWVDPIVSESDGHRFYTVATETGCASIRLAVDTEQDARELRELLNRIKPSAL